MTEILWQDRRLGGLRRFAVGISVLNLIGYTVLGFEPSWAAPLAALAGSYGTELLLETIDAVTLGRRPRYRGGLRSFVDFLLPAHISGLAISMLLYSNGRLWVLVFAGCLAIVSKRILRVPIRSPRDAGGSWRRVHFLNPSNCAMTVTLLAFPWVGPAPPYQFVENVRGWWDWLLPAVLLTTGSLINTKFSGRMPLIASWFAAFAAQALVRSALNGTPALAGLLPMTGLAFILYSFYMVTDPATTPTRAREQVVFGAGVAVVYGVLLQLHIVWGLFYSLAIVNLVRGACLLYSAWQDRRAAAEEGVEVVKGAAVAGGA